MKRSRFFCFARWGVLALLLPAGLALAEDHGPDPGLTGAPGEQTCTSCHAGTALNAGGGKVALTLPNGSTYTPGTKQRITITITDGTATRYGFQLTARLTSNPASAQAGSFEAPSTRVQVLCSTGRVAPCTSSAVLQYAEHTLTGYRAASNSYEVDWTAPESGEVTFYVAANAANGNGNNSGDKIYSATLQVSPAATTAKPAISSTRGVTNGASFGTTIAPQTWVTIAGSNLAAGTRLWSGADIVNGKLPTSLDGVGVTINGKAAYVQYISPTQINVLSPADTATGNVEVRVTNNGQSSEPVVVTQQAVSPALFTFDGKYAAATHADASLLGKTGLFPSAPTATVPGKPGETIILYATGLGATGLSATGTLVPDGEVTTGLANVAATVKVLIGGAEAQVVYAGLAPGFARLYQLNVRIPEAAADGDLPVVVETGGGSSQTGIAITVAR